jgi:Uma2 family endonuclease
MALSNTIIPHYTYKDYVQWEGRWELIEGHPIAMSPLPIPEHQQLSANLIYEFKDGLKKKCGDCKIYSPLDYKISEDTTIQPDVLIVSGKIKKPYLDFSPVLTVEILSPSTMLRDRNTKYLIYQQQGVKYYLIVDADKRKIEIYELVNRKYQAKTYNNNFEFLFNDNCKICPQLDNIWE